MGGIELWTTSVHVPGRAAAMGRRAERDGYDGIGFGDTQNIAPDPYLGLLLAAGSTTRLRLGVRVANPVTRAAAVTAAAIATVQLESGGRAVLGVGRGDSATSHVDGRAAPVGRLSDYLSDLQGYLGADAFWWEEHEPDGAGRRRVRPLSWLPAELPKVPLDVAASGARTADAGARWAECLTLNVGADPERLAAALAHVGRAPRPPGAPALSVGAYLNVVAHPDPAVAHELVRGPAAAYARMSGMHGAPAFGGRPDDRHVYRDVTANYDLRLHGRSGASHTRFLTDDFLARFAVAGPPDYCTGRLVELARLGLERLVIVGPAPDGDPRQVEEALRFMARHVVPAVREALARS